MSAGNGDGIAAMSAAIALFVASGTLMNAAIEGTNPAQLLFVRGIPLVSAIFLLAWRLRALEYFDGLMQSRTLPDTPTLAGIGLIVAAGLHSLLRDKFSARDRDRQASD